MVKKWRVRYVPLSKLPWRVYDPRCAPNHPCECAPFDTREEAIAYVTEKTDVPTLVITPREVEQIEEALTTPPRIIPELLRDD